jgi:hypothetical protein
MQLFWAALPNDIRNAVTQNNPETITLNQMYGIVTMMHKESNAQKILAIENNEDGNLEEGEAFQRRQNWQRA